MSGDKRENTLSVERVVLTVDEVCKIFGLGKSSAYDAIAHGHIPSIRIGGRIRVPRAAVERMLNPE